MLYQGKKSRIPPRVLVKIASLPDQERRIYLQELMGKYHVKAVRVDKAAKYILKDWAANQRAHFERVIEELNWLLQA